MDTRDEIPLEDHRYFQARLDYLAKYEPVALLTLLETGSLTEHLRRVTAMAVGCLGKLIIHRNLPQDQADELVMSQIIADPPEQTRLDIHERDRLERMLQQYRTMLPHLPRTYMSQRETTG